jgi:uncharacterized protein
MPTFKRRTTIAVTPEDLFAWHARPGAFERLAPPWQSVDLVEHDGIEDGARAVLDLGPGPFPLRWVVEHRDYEEGAGFRDVQLRGPFARWEHTHRMLPHDVDRRRSVLEDHVEYELPLSWLSQPLAGAFATRELARLFGYRHRVTREDLERHARADLSPMRIVVTGSSGLVGRALTAFLTTGGHTVVRLVRSRSEVIRLARSEQEQAAFWDPYRGVIDPAALHGADAVIHLAGEPILGGLWTSERKARVMDSRIRGTRLIAESIAAMDAPPRVLISASASGYYGDRGNEPLSEDSPAGEGFLAEVCQDWERAASGVADAGVRLCVARIGVVLSPQGGALRLMRAPFLLGLGGRIGKGREWIPWIALDDVLYGILHLLAHESQAGPFNFTAPNPVTQRELAKTLGDVLGRPAAVRIPRALVSLTSNRLVLADALRSARVVPDRLVNSPFAFAYPRLDDALAHLLGRPPVVEPELMSE